MNIHIESKCSVNVSQTYMRTVCGVKILKSHTVLYKTQRPGDRYCSSRYGGGGGGKSKTSTAPPSLSGPPPAPTVAEIRRLYGNDISCMCGQFNMLLAGVPLAGGFLPLGEENIFGRLNSGVLLCALAMALRAEAIDERAVIRDPANPSDVSRNLNLALTCLETQGVCLDNGTESVDATMILEEGTQILVGILLQIIRLLTVCRVNLKDKPDLAYTLENRDPVEIAAIGSMPRVELMKHWVNYQLKGSDLQVTEVTPENLSDCVVYANLLNTVAPKEKRASMVKVEEIVGEKDEMKRATMVVQNAKILGLDGVIGPEHIVNNSAVSTGTGATGADGTGSGSALTKTTITGTNAADAKVTNTSTTGTGTTGTGTTSTGTTSTGTTGTGTTGTGTTGTGTTGTGTTGTGTTGTGTTGTSTTGTGTTGTGTAINTTDTKVTNTTTTEAKTSIAGTSTTHVSTTDSKTCTKTTCTNTTGTSTTDSKTCTNITCTNTTGSSTKDSKTCTNTTSSSTRGTDTCTNTTCTNTAGTTTCSSSTCTQPTIANDDSQASPSTEHVEAALTIRKNVITTAFIALTAEKYPNIVVPKEKLDPKLNEVLKLSYKSGASEETLIMWINVFGPTSPVLCLENDLRSGITLLQAFDGMSEGCVNWSKVNVTDVKMPKRKFVWLDNCSQVMECAKKLGIKVNCSAMDIASGQKTNTLALVFVMMLKHTQLLRARSIGGKPSDMDDKSLVQWFNAQMKEYGAKVELKDISDPTLKSTNTLGYFTERLLNFHCTCRLCCDCRGVPWQPNKASPEPKSEAKAKPQIKPATHFNNSQFEEQPGQGADDQGVSSFNAVPEAAGWLFAVVKPVSGSDLELYSKSTITMLRQSGVAVYTNKLGPENDIAVYRSILLQLNSSSSGEVKA